MTRVRRTAGALAALLAGAGALSSQPVLPSGRTPVLLSAAPPSTLAADSALARLQEEGLHRSRVLATATHLSDVLGPRLAGSPEYREAAEWARRELASYGLSNARLDPWGRRGGASWSIERYSVEMRAPRYQRLVAYPKAWSPPLKGTARGTPMLVDIRADSDLVRYRGRMRGRILMNGRPQPARPQFGAQAHRFTDSELDSLARLSDAGEPKDYQEDVAGYASRVARRNALAAELRREGAIALLEPSRSATAVVVSGYQAYGSDVREVIPAFIVARTDYDRVGRLVESGARVELELSLATRVARDDGIGYNILAELPGSDSAVRDEVVMIGGHFDSWTAATGATDNAAGVAVAMEALRLLAATGARPRRTIRIALWDGEEHEEYWGSRGYVLKYLGDPETGRRLAAPERVVAYFNVDHGTGKIRGLYLQGNAAARGFFEPVFAPFAPLGASTLTLKRVGSTDHMPFVGVGVPAFTFIQDPIDYETRTHHTNLDAASSLLEEDLKQAAVVAAGVLLQTANADRPVPGSR